jgi:sucrose phosphorylase
MRTYSIVAALVLIAAGIGFGFWRQSVRRDQSIFCIHNITDEIQQVSLGDINLIGTDQWQDLISGLKIDDLSGSLTLKPYQSVWLSNRE